MILRYFYFCACIFITSCFPSGGYDLTGRDAHLYDNVGFEPGQRPNERPQSSQKAPVAITADYYYRTAPRNSGSVVVPSAPVEFAPASRFYSNPYSLKPPQNFPLYDSDHYYSPPKNSSYQEYIGPQNPSQRNINQQNQQNIYQ